VNKKYGIKILKGVFRYMNKCHDKKKLEKIAEEIKEEEKMQKPKGDKGKDVDSEDEK
jgi:hypothetical protein